MLWFDTCPTTVDSDIKHDSIDFTEQLDSNAEHGAYTVTVVFCGHVEGTMAYYEGNYDRYRSNSDDS